MEGISRSSAKTFKLRLVCDIVLGEIMSADVIVEVTNAIISLSDGMIYRDKSYVNKSVQSLDIILSNSDIPYNIRSDIVKWFSATYKLPINLLISIHRRMYGKGSPLHLEAAETIPIF